MVDGLILITGISSLTLCLASGRCRRFGPLALPSYAMQACALQTGSVYRSSPRRSVLWAYRQTTLFNSTDQLGSAISSCHPLVSRNSYAGYRTFQLLCNAIGRRACAAGAFERDRTPIYYSKSRLKSAVGVIVNEHEVERMLQAAGVKVVYPETLGLLDQIQLMSSRDNIIGTAGSFLHTSIFCPPRRITCLNVTEKINANYVIVDKLNNNLAAYYYAPALRVLNKQDGFLTARYLPDAAIVAEEA